MSRADRYAFPEGFLIGSATAAYQVDSQQETRRGSAIDLRRG